MTAARMQRLLVVDDEAVQRILVTGVAERMGYAVDGASTLDAAVSRIRETAYDVIVLDLSLGKNDGVQLLRSLHGYVSDPKLVFMSCFDERVRLAAARLASANGLRVAGTMGKPLNLARLRDLLRAAPEHSAQQSRGRTGNIDPGVLAQAIADGEVSCMYQPKVRLQDRGIVGVEALARWNSPLLGNVPPDVFIPLAEKAGLIDILTRSVLDQALADFSGWHHIGRGMTLAVNISPLGLTDLTLPEQVSEALQTAGVAPGSLVLEVTERAMISDFSVAGDILTRLRIRGVMLSIDDFGTGHSSLLSLMHLPFSELKIDQSFVRTCLTDPEAPKIIRGIVGVAQALDLQIVAEGIETEEIAKLVEDIGCLVGQGYLYARPLSPGALTTRLLEEAPVAAAA